MSFQMLKKKFLKEEIKKIRKERSKTCIKCGFDVKLSSRRRDEVICTAKFCKHRANIWKDTIFYLSKLNKTKILRILELWMQKASYNVISYVTRTDRKTIWRLMCKVSALLNAKYYNNCPKIGGDNMIIEIDESKFGKRKYNRGHSVEGVWIFGMVERSEQRKIHLVAVDNRKAETLLTKLTNNIKNDSVIYSDCWKGYKNVIHSFIDHLQVNHSKNFKDPITGTHTNTIEGNWAGIKMNVPFRGRTKEKINLYLIRYMLLRNESSKHPLKSIINYLFYFIFFCFLV